LDADGKPTHKGRVLTLLDSTRGHLTFQSVSEGQNDESSLSGFFRRWVLYGNFFLMAELAIWCYAGLQLLWAAFLPAF
jgi:hypothetical protein